MTSYTLFSQATPGGSSVQADTAAYTMGVQFSVSQAGTMAAVWWYSPAGAGELPETIALYAVSGATLVHSESATWSGAAGSGWVRAAFASPPALTASAAYKACILKSGPGNHWYTEADNYWSSGPGAAGVTNGPLSAPNSAGASPGQDSFNTGATLTYPGSTFGAANYWVDVEVSVSSAVSGTGSAAASKAELSGGGAESVPGTGSARASKASLAGSAKESLPGSGGAGASKPALSGAGAEKFPGSGGSAAPSASLHGSGWTTVSGSGGVVLARPSLSGAGSSARAVTGTGAVSLRKASLAGLQAAAVVQSKGSWWGLDTILKESREEFDAYWDRAPLDCPICGQPLVNAPSSRSGSGVELYCDYAGDHQYHYPRDRDVPVRMDSGGLVSPFDR